MVKNERTLAVTEDGGAEIDADDAFEQHAAAIDEVLERSAGDDRPIGWVAASSFWHSLMGIDANGRPTTKVFGWADTRSRGHVTALRRRFNEAEIHNRTGARFHSSFWPAKLLWVRKEMPKEFGRTARWLSLSDLAASRLFGEAVTSVSMASGTGIFDIRKCDWDAELLRYLKVKRSSLPAIAAGPDTFKLTPKYARRWPRLKDAGWFPAIGDGAANNIGAGCLKRTKAALMIGTSGAMRVAYAGDPPEHIPLGLWCYRIDRKRVIIGGALSDGGGLYRWLKDNLRISEDDDHTEDEIARRSPAGHGITYLPFIAGERSTGYNENAAGAIIGLRSSHDQIDITQAALEGVAYRFAAIFDQLKTVVPVREVIASGGALRASPVWTQIIADTLGINLSLPDTREASSRGAVLLALETAGALENIENTPTPPGRQFEADRKRRVIYNRARKLHDKFYDLIIDSPSE